MKFSTRVLLTLGALTSVASGCSEPTEPSPPIPVAPPAPAAPVVPGAPAASSNRYIYLANSSGGNEQRLSPGYSPAWSPDGSKIAFVAELDGGKRDAIYVVNADGTAPKPLTSGNIMGPLRWSSDGSKIAFVSLRDYASIYQMALSIINADGTNVKHVWLESNGQPAMWCNIAGWSPDGTRIAFVSAPEGSGALQIMNSDGTNLRTLTKMWVNGADWSPDGRRFALHAQGAVYAINADWSGLTQLTNDSDSLHVSNVKWSPQGDRILFDLVYNEAYVNRTPPRSRPYKIDVVDADGTNRIRVLSAGENLRGESGWLPDGRAVGWDAFAKAETWTVPASGGTPSLLLSDALDAVWSPDGAQIAYVRNAPK